LCDLIGYTSQGRKRLPAKLGCISPKKVKLLTPTSWLMCVCVFSSTWLLRFETRSSSTRYRVPRAVRTPRALDPFSYCCSQNTLLVRFCDSINRSSVTSLCGEIEWLAVFLAIWMSALWLTSLPRDCSPLTLIFISPERRKPNYRYRYQRVASSSAPGGFIATVCDIREQNERSWYTQHYQATI